MLFPVLYEACQRTIDIFQTDKVCILPNHTLLKSYFKIFELLYILKVKKSWKFYRQIFKNLRLRYIIALYGKHYWIFNRRMTVALANQRALCYHNYILQGFDSESELAYSYILAKLLINQFCFPSCKYGFAFKSLQYLFWLRVTKITLAKPSHVNIGRYYQDLSRSIWSKYNSFGLNSEWV